MDKRTFNSLPIIETDRLILRNFRLEDAKRYFLYHNNPNAITYYDWKPNTLADAEEDIKLTITSYVELNCVRWAITTKETDDIIGDCGLITGELKAEINYMLSEGSWGQGLMAEALGAIISYCFQHTDLLRIQALCQPENHFSNELLKTLGFKLEGLLRKYGQNLITNENNDLLMWSVLKEDFRNLHKYNVIALKQY